MPSVSPFGRGPAFFGGLRLSVPPFSLNFVVRLFTGLSCSLNQVKAEFSSPSWSDVINGHSTFPR